MRRPARQGSPVVVKIGSSSLTASEGGVDRDRIATLVGQLAHLHAGGHVPVLVSSGAIAAGFVEMGLERRPSDIAGLQVAAAVGQTRLMRAYGEAFAQHGLLAGQVLLTQDVLGSRTQYLNARAALERMATSSVVAIVNENDTVAVDEVRFGDNDRLAAIAAHLVSAGMLVILTDTDGLYSEDPRVTESAELVAAIEHTDGLLDRIGTDGTRGILGSGGITTKIMAARMAASSSVPTVIASADAPEAVLRAVAGDTIGTWIDPRPRPLPARKLWIAYARTVAGRIRIDGGAETALGDGGSLLAVGVTDVEGSFERGDAVEILGPDDSPMAKGLTRLSAVELRAVVGEHSSVAGGEVVHRDDLVIVGSLLRETPPLA